MNQFLKDFLFDKTLRDGKITTSIEIKFGTHMQIVTSLAYNEWHDFMRSLRVVLMQVKSGLHLY